MKYCFNYTRKSDVLYLLDEINIKFDPEDVDVLFEYALDHKHQRINARIVDIDHIFKYNLLDEFEDFHIEHPEIDFSIILPKYDLNLANVCKEKGLKFFFDIVVRDWETLNLYADAGVSDVYLVEQMMFEIKDAATAAHKRGIKVRTFPNIVQKRYEETPTLKSFFIRPEDIDLYEGLVDVMELHLIDEIDQDVLFEIYKEDGKWIGPLKEIIIGLDCDLDGRYIIPRFGERRLGCGRKCFKGARCDVCETVQSIGDNLKKAGFMIRYSDKEEESDGKRSSSQERNNTEDTSNV